MFKKILTVVGIMAALSVGVTTHAAVTEIQPDKNIGVYTKNQAVSFVIARDDTTEAEEFSFIVENVDGEQVRTGNAAVAAGETECTVSVGNYIPGWYRLRVYDSDSAEIDIFASFTVVENWTKTIDKSPFSAMLFGYSGLTESRIPDYAEALGILGMDSVRDSAGWYWGSGAEASIDKTVDPLCENDITPLLTYSVHNDHLGTERDYDGNLYTIHNMLETLSGVYDGKVGRWEITNEPDLKSSQNGFSADMYSSYYRAAALALEEGSPDTVKSFGGLCQKYPDFFEIMMMNGVADYTDTFNVHRHSTSNVLKNNIEFSASSLLKRAKLYSAIYGGNQPLCVSEAGISAPIDDNGVQKTEHLKIQAKYAITSFVESIGMYGTTEHYWFIARHYLENGSNWGSTSPNHCTYPVFYSLSMLTRYLGEGVPLGTISNSDAEISGYFFDAGDYDAAVLWNSSDDVKYQQLKTTGKVIVNNLIGGTEYVYGTENNGLVNIPLTSEPVIVRFDGNADESNYIKKTFDTDFVRDISRTVGDKVVIQAQWPDGTTVENGRYVLTPEETYTVTLNIYNFNDERVSGNINLITDANAVCESVLGSYVAFAESSATITTLSYDITISSDAENAYKGYISFEGTANSSDIPALVCGYVIDKELTKEDIGTVTELCDTVELSSPWTNGNATLGISRNISKTLFKAEYTFTASFNGGNRFWYPVLNKTVDADSDGLVFDFNGISTSTGAYLGVFASVQGGSYWIKVDSLTVGEKSYVLPWGKFGAYSGDVPETLDPADITGISIGFNAYADSEVKYTLSGIGTYDISETSFVEEYDLKFEGISDEGVYREGTVPELKIIGEFDEIYLNYEEFDGYTSSDDGVIIDLSDLEPAAYSIIVARNKDFGRKEYKEITFCIKSANDYSSGGVFY